MQRVGLTLPIQHSFDLPTYVDLAVRAEEMGYNSVWIPEVAGPDAFTLMTAIATRTNKVMLCSGVIPVQIRTPVTFAFSASSVDAFAPGRVVLGLGTSSPIIVNRWHGVPYDAPLQRMREATAIIRQVWEGRKSDFKGTYYSTAGFRSPIYPQRIGLYYGALNKKMLMLAGELADGVLFNWLPAHAVRDKIAAVKEGAVAAGRSMDDVDVACYVRACVADNVDLAREHLRRELTAYVPVPTYRKQFIDAGYEDEVMRALEKWNAGDRKSAVTQISDRMVDEINVLGSDEAECLKRLKAFRDAGIDHVIVAPWSGGPDTSLDVAVTLEAFAPSRAGDY